MVAKEWNERNVSLESECVTEYEAKVRPRRQSSAGRWEGSDAGVAVVQVVVTAGPRDELQDWQSLGVH